MKQSFFTRYIGKRMSLLLLVFFLLFPARLSSAEDYILFISSFDTHQIWPVAVENSFRSKIDKSGYNLRVTSEYLNVNHLSPPDTWLELMRTILKHYTEKPPKIVVLLADEAWITFRKAYNGEFGDVPIILCSGKEYTIDFDLLFDKSSITWGDLIPTSSLTKDYNVTGIIDVPKIEETIRFMQRLQPEMDEVALISDSRFYGMYVALQTQEIMREKFPNYKLNMLDGRFLSTDSLLVRLKMLPPNSSVLLASWLLNVSRSFENYAVGHERIVNLANRPVFSLYDWGALNRLFMGGYRVESESYSTAAISIIDRIMKGEPASDIPFMENFGEVNYFLNAQLIEKYDINPALIPEDVILFNLPEGFISKYKVQIIYVLLVVLVIISALLVSLLRSQNLRRELADSKNKTDVLLRNQQAISETLYHFLQSNTEENAVIPILEQVLKKYNADRISIFEYDDTYINFDKIHTVASPYAAETESSLPPIESMQLPSLLEAMKRQIVLIEDHTDNNSSRLTAEEREVFLCRGIIGAISAPVFLDKKLWGIVGLDFRSMVPTYKEEDILYLHALSQVFSIGIEHFRMQSQRKEMESLFKCASGNANVGVAHWNCCTGKTSSTDLWYQNMGENKQAKSVVEVIKTHTYVHPDERDELNDMVNKAIRNEIQNFSRSVRVWNGERWAWIRCLCILNDYEPEKNNVRLVFLNMNIDELKESEADLIAAKAKAEESDRLKSAFLANMSHEIRTPLNAIVGFSSLLQNERDEARIKEYSEIIGVNNRLLLQLIDDILDLSKIEAGVLDFADDKIDLFSFFKDLEATYSLRKPFDVRLVYEIDEPFIVIIDSNRLNQVMGNLLGNAFKFTRTGHVHFGYKKRDSDVWFFVEDTGIGIPPDKKDSVFHRFVKLDSFEQGTGLGLSICSTIIAHWGGEVGLESEEGRGSTFWFTIPLATLVKPSDYAPAVAASDEKTAKNGMPSAEKPLVLVAEDVSYNYRLIEIILKNDYRLLHALDGSEAVEMFHRYRPAIILMDIKMPGMDGREAILKIREVSNVPIIAISASAYDDDRAQVAKDGCNAFLSKPLKADELTGLIETLLYSPSTLQP